eukprot:9359823-Karenia_brevis.AAC.1
MISHVFRKHWRYMGHLARKVGSDEQMLVNYRTSEFYMFNAALHHRNPSKVLHRQSGAQRPIFDKYMHEAASFFQWQDMWQNVAQSRATWKEFENPFIEHMLAAYLWQ